MSPLNFDLAPPAKTVDGLLAVPIDIQQIDALLTMDAAAGTGSGDATLQFTLGPTAGCPIFDLRQTITAAWLDGVPVPLTQVAHHDFGGGLQSELRVLAAPLAAGSVHTLRLSYSLGPPQASGAGSYQPALTFSAGPRVAFNFGFTDLGAGRYLEAWVPSNLIFDQFTLHLHLRLLGTALPHTVISNGALSVLGAGDWQISFPSRFSALSPLLELRATDTLASASQSFTLPVSGTAVSVEAWKLAASGIDLAAEIASIGTWLAENEISTGPYLHGNRFVAFLNVGGMEYEGGTTASPSALRHETFHSWWARGVKPASQADGWWDEAWTVYHDDGMSGVLPFDFTEPAVTLASRNPWVRVTPSNAYTDGERVFEGLAALMGAPALGGHMASLYSEHSSRPMTSAELECALLRRSGQATIVDAFHRFVFGFAEPAPAADLWIKDDPGDPGGDLWSGRFWDSPDLWIRHEDDGGLVHQDPRHGADNWFHARVRNRSAASTARHFVVTFAVHPFAGLEFIYPGDFLPCIAAQAGFELAPGSSTILKARWPAALVPPAGAHACWLASVLSRGDQPLASRHVWEQNGLAQKNLSVVKAPPGEWFVLPFQLNRLEWKEHRIAQLELWRPRGWDHLEASLLHRSGSLLPGGPHRVTGDAASRERGEQLECGGVQQRRVILPSAVLRGQTPDATAARRLLGAPDVHFVAGHRAAIPVQLRPACPVTAALRLRVPEHAPRGARLQLDLIGRDGKGKLIGGLALEIEVA